MNTYYIITCELLLIISLITLSAYVHNMKMSTLSFISLKTMPTLPPPMSPTSPTTTPTTTPTTSPT